MRVIAANRAGRMRSMRRVLILAYHWPPIGGIGPARVLGVVRTLRENGYEPIVITGAGTSTDRFAPIDATLGQRVPDGLEVIRIASPEPDSTRLRHVGRLDRMVSRDDPFAKWWASESLKAARSVGPGRHFSCRDDSDCVAERRRPH